MKKVNRITVNSISQLHHMLNISSPLHPLVSVIKLDELNPATWIEWEQMILNYYNITVKKSLNASMRYGQSRYDFNQGTMAFISPGQMISLEATDPGCKGWCISFHPDFINQYPLGKQIKNFGFFSYDVNEALHLSEKEDTMMDSIITNLKQEYEMTIDNFSQELMVSHLELLLNYSNRFYTRQFITRKTVGNNLLARLEEILTEYFSGNLVAEMGLPTVQYISAKLNVSPSYLSDMLRNLTGQNTQQHIHSKLIDKAKQALSTTSLSVSEIAYQLGFEYPQSFNKLFKNKTELSPLEYRNLFN
ncbi:MAG: helix-turn-helix transcriptional regulator [Gemmatimonadaceae bacterium]|nr:helix-turn-helix transcriptional regulator [Chitinophagaceae bacterium]